jgi:two-component system, NtrC family, response regulator GlrR
MMPNVFVVGEGRQAQDLAALLHAQRESHVAVLPAIASTRELAPPDVLILTTAVAAAGCEDLSAQLREACVTCPVLAVVGRSGLERELARLDAGVADFLLWPYDDAEVRARVRRAIGRGRAALVEQTAADLRRETAPEVVIGDAPAFAAIKAKLPQVARAEATVVLQGETGTGKEVVARAIHYMSPRAGGPFLPVNCGAIPRELIENELFGHRRGAYTDAREPARGLIAQAEGGTLFLDEVDAIPLAGQVKLLQFLQSKRYRPLGASAMVQADVRIVAATNRDLEDEVGRGTFREDLYYRLNIISLRLPALRERTEDLPRLAAHFLSRHNAGSRAGGWSLTAELLATLALHSWPGNVRELENLIEQMVALNPRGPLGLEALPPRFRSAEAPPGRLAPFRQAKAAAIAAFERTYASQLLAEHAGNVTAAARAAGKDRRAFGRLVKKHRVQKGAVVPVGRFRPTTG